VGMAKQLVKTIWRIFYASDSDLAAKAVLINVRRLRYVSLLAIPVLLAHIVVFAVVAEPQGEIEKLWHERLVLAHSTALLCMLIVGIGAWHTPARGRPGLVEYLLQWGTMALVLCAGMAVAAIDQLVTSAITPFLSMTVMVAALFLLRPVVAFGTFSAALIVFWVVLGWLQSDPAVLLSSRVNSLTVVSIGFCLATVMWAAFVRSTRQRAHIERQRAELAEKNAALELLAALDPLTGLANRRSFEAQAQREMVNMRRAAGTASLVITDVDHFKRINDLYGHPFGDELLREFAAALRSRLRATDLVARWGGEEFLILLPGCDTAEAVKIANTIREQIARTEFEIRGIKINVTASFGVAPLRVDEPDALPHSYRLADQALYAAKQAGRNRVEVGVPESAFQHAT